MEEDGSSAAAAVENGAAVEAEGCVAVKVGAEGEPVGDRGDLAAVEEAAPPAEGGSEAASPAEEEEEEAAAAATPKAPGKVSSASRASHEG